MAAAASACLPRRPSITTSVVITAICDNWVIANGQARRSKARASAIQGLRPDAVP
jgi:hypothetical protein